MALASLGVCQGQVEPGTHRALHGGHTRDLVTICLPNPRLRASQRRWQPSPVCRVPQSPPRSLQCGTWPRAPLTPRVTGGFAFPLQQEHRLGPRAPKTRTPTWCHHFLAPYLLTEHRQAWEVPRAPTNTNITLSCFSTSNSRSENRIPKSTLAFSCELTIIIHRK